MNAAKSAVSAVLIVSLTACTSMDQYFPNGVKTFVGDDEYLVRQLPDGSYQAMPDSPGGKSLVNANAPVWAANIKAIEQVSGCKVVPGATKNSSTVTTAAVSC